MAERGLGFRVQVVKGVCRILEMFHWVLSMGLKN